VESIRNWAGNLTFSTTELHIPTSVEEVQEIVARSKQIKVLGTKHSFNSIADSDVSLLSLEKLNQVIAIDTVNHKVTVEGGIRYGELCKYLHEQGYAIHNLASLPHITVAGACATATHGSGVGNGNLATGIDSLELVQANGEVVVFSRDSQERNIASAIVGLGALGVITKITLDLIPTFHMQQFVYDDLPLIQLEKHADEIFSDSYSVSLFTDWKEASFNQVWRKRIVNGEDLAGQVEFEFYGAKLATANRHPVPGHTAENCSVQMGVSGPWHERLPHFRMDFTPSAGEELQSEYYVPRQYAYEALCALNDKRKQIAPLLYVSEVRTIAADELWMSPCYKQDSVAVHFTWKPNWAAVQQVLPIIEEQLAPYQARPHWGKLFTMDPAVLQSRFEKLPAFRDLVLQCDPQGKFRNTFLETNIMGKN
jgi:xylitol oxidase